MIATHWLACLIFSSISLNGQVSLEGQVVDAASGAGLEAVVQIGDEAHLTDSFGELIWTSEEALPAGITIHVMGYHPKVVEIEELGEGRFRFLAELHALDAEQLETVVVTASRYQQKQEELSVSLSVMKPRVIEGRNTTDGRDILPMVSGVHVTDGQLNIRNGSGWTYGAGTRVQVLLDDVPLISPDAGQIQWDLMPIEAIEQVEVLKGASSALFGTSALNGVVQFRTIRPKAMPLTKVNVFHTVYGDPPRPELKWWDGWRSNAGIQWLHAFKRKKHEWVLSGYGQKDEGFKFSESDEQARINWSYRFCANEQLEFGMNGGVLWSENGESLLWNSRSEAYVALDSSVTVTKGIDAYLDPYLNWRKDRHRHGLKGRFLRVENNSQNLTTVFDNASDQFQLQYNYQYFGNAWIISGGLFGLYSESRSELFGGFHTTANAAAYAQFDRKWEGGQVNLGMRYESQWVDDGNYARPVMRLGVNQKLAKATFMRLSFGQGFRFPSMAELFTESNIGSIYLYPNTRLKPETGYSAEIGLRQLIKGRQKGSWLAKWDAYVDAAFYLMRFDDMMEFSFSNWGTTPSNPFGIGFKSINIGATQIHGIELESGAERKWDDWTLSLLAGYNFSVPRALDAEIPYAKDSTGLPISYRSSSSDSTDDILKYRYRNLLRMDLQISSKKWTFGTSLRYNDYMQNVDGIFEGPLVELLIPGVGIREAREQLERPDWMLDTRVYYQIDPQWSVGFLVQNVLNYEVMSRPAELEAPRRFTLSIRFKG